MRYRPRRPRDVIDDVTKECMAAVADASILGRRVARELDAVMARRGKPGLIVSNAMLAWAQGSQIVWRFIAPTSRTGSLRHSTDACLTNCSTRRSSATSTTPVPP